MNNYSLVSTKLALLFAGWKSAYDHRAQCGVASCKESSRKLIHTHTYI